MPSIFTGPVTASAPTNVIAGIASAQAVASNVSRVGLTLTNISTSTVYLGFSSNAAVLNAGIVLAPNSGVFSMDEYSYNTEQINAIAHSAGNILTIQEFIRY